jgi:hypothetical protein
VTKLPGLGRQQEGVRWRPDASLTPPAKGLSRWSVQAAAKHRWALIALDLQVDTSTVELPSSPSDPRPIGSTSAITGR